MTKYHPFGILFFICIIRCWDWYFCAHCLLIQNHFQYRVGLISYYHFLKYTRQMMIINTMFNYYTQSVYHWFIVYSSSVFHRFFRTQNRPILSVSKYADDWTLLHILRSASEDNLQCISWRDCYRGHNLLGYPSITQNALWWILWQSVTSS